MPIIKNIGPTAISIGHKRSLNPGMTRMVSEQELQLVLKHHTGRVEVIQEKAPETRPLSAPTIEVVEPRQPVTLEQDEIETEVKQNVSDPGESQKPVAERHSGKKWNTKR